MNDGRRGDLSHTHTPLIRLLASIRLMFYLYLPYRQVKGFARGMSKYVKGDSDSRVYDPE